MRFDPLPIGGAYMVTPEPHADERGFFARTWSAAAFGERGLAPVFAECSVSWNPQRGTLRGLHYQAAPNEEAKLVSCVRGSVWDVIVDLREGSPTYLAWHATELDSANLTALYVPEGCAHGFLTLTGDALVTYQISVPHAPASARGIRWDDPAIGITWPGQPRLMSGRDAAFADVPASAQRRHVPPPEPLRTDER